MCRNKFLTSNFKDKLKPILSKLDKNKKLGLLVKFAPLIGELPFALILVILKQ